MKHFHRKNVAVVFLILLPLALFFWMREKVSWQPQKIAVLSQSGEAFLSPDARFVAESLVEPGASKPEIVVIRNLESGHKVKCSVWHHRSSSLVFSADGKQLAWAWSQTTAHKMENDTKRIGVSWWNLKGKPRDFEMVKGDLMFDRPTQLRFSPDGKTLWMASTDNLRSWDVHSGQLKSQWRTGDLGRDSSFPYDSTTSEDCQLYFRNDSDGYTVWDVKTNKRLVRTKLPFLYDEGLEFSSDGAYATYYGDAFTVGRGIVYPVVETRTGRVLWESAGEFPLIFVGDEAIRLKTDKLEVFDARNGKLLRILPAVPGAVLPLRPSRWLCSMNKKHELFRQRFR